ncbi:ATP-binding protein [Rhodococcus sp. TAF43]|uniref:ATP-binding protein n=1 Tax=unclassified Rhodococcus (in: high G+C Gram-positive bacteria) TaxID=192944 RepID=UPI001582B568|nr:ATP-binding protein [Rhodococcus sp. W8901]QKT11871.1 ATP-binding protein [Rhodococcus sp. W8901]
MSEACLSTRRSEDSAPVIELRTAADAYQLAAIRRVSTSLAAQCDMTLDQLADLRLAVDEACSILLRIALPDSVIVCTFRVSADSFDFAGCVPTTGAELEGQYEQTFGWHVLRTLTNELALDRHPGTGDGRSPTITISFAMRCGESV